MNYNLVSTNTSRGSHINAPSIFRDNVHTDIFGMNLYREYVRRHRHSKNQVAMQGARGLDLSTQDFRGLTADQCYSVLVRVSALLLFQFGVLLFWCFCLHFYSFFSIFV